LPTLSLLTRSHLTQDFGSEVWSKQEGPTERGLIQKGPAARKRLPADAEDLFSSVEKGFERLGWGESRSGSTGATFSAGGGSPKLTARQLDGLKR
jgi:hypothetical protein